MVQETQFLGRWLKRWQVAFPYETASCSDQVGLTLMAQRLLEMARGREANLYGSRVSGLMEEKGEVVGEWSFP